MSWSPRARIDGVFAVSPLLDLLEHRRQVELLQVGRQLLVVPGGRRVRGEVVQERQVVAFAEDEALKIEGARDQDQPLKAMPWSTRCPARPAARVVP